MDKGSPCPGTHGSSGFTLAWAYGIYMRISCAWFQTMDDGGSRGRSSGSKAAEKLQRASLLINIDQKILLFAKESNMEACHISRDLSR